MTLAAPARDVSLAQWEADWRFHDDAYELVAGVPTVPPAESVGNLDIAALLHERIAPVVRPDHLVLSGCGVHLRTPDGRDTVRQPDLIVVPRPAERARSYVPAADVALAVEVVSASSIERDWVTKRGEYGAAGIPAYLVIDPRSAPEGAPHLALFVLGPDGYDEPVGDGTRVTVRIGDHVIELLASELIG